MQIKSSFVLSLTVLNIVLSLVFFGRSSTNQTFGYKWLELENNRKVLQGQYEQTVLGLSESKSLHNIYEQNASASLDSFDKAEFLSSFNDIAYVE